MLTEADISALKIMKDALAKDDGEDKEAMFLLTHMVSIIDRQSKALDLIDQQNRSRGYPTGREWYALSEKIKNIMQGGGE